MLNPKPAKSKATLLKEWFYPETKFGGLTHVDGTVDFYTRVHALTNSESVVLDVGCGRGRYEDDEVPLRRDLRIFKDKVQKVIGIDVDLAGRENPYLDEFQPIDGPRWPVADESIDVCVCDFVLEHIEDPEGFFDEVARVLRPGGVFCTRTPNAYSYVALISRMVPDKHHAKVVAKAQESRKEEDVFPTFYRCNTIGKFKRLFKRRNFDCHVTTITGHPSYLTFSRFAYFFGYLHQRFSPKPLGMAILAFGRKRIPTDK